MNNQAHFHLIINHFPIILPIVGFVILIIGFFLKAELVKRIAYGIFICAIATTFLAMNSGEGAEEIVEELGRNHDAIHRHEKFAETFSILSYLLGITSAIALFLNWKKHPFKNLTMFLVIGISMIVMYLASGTGYSGGEISHEEIKSISAQPSEDE
jgi:uncharacterized membrane protein